MIFKLLLVLALLIGICAMLFIVMQEDCPCHHIYYALEDALR